MNARGIAIEVSPDDLNDLAVVTIGGESYNYCKYLDVQGAGDIRYIDPRGQTLTVAVSTGVHPIQARRIYLTGTTAAGILAIY